MPQTASAPPRASVHGWGYGVVTEIASATLRPPVIETLVSVRLPSTASTRAPGWLAARPGDRDARAGRLGRVDDDVLACLQRRAPVVAIEVPDQVRDRAAGLVADPHDLALEHRVLVRDDRQRDRAAVEGGVEGDRLPGAARCASAERSVVVPDGGVAESSRLLTTIGAFDGCDEPPPPPQPLRMTSSARAVNRSNAFTGVTLRVARWRPRRRRVSTSFQPGCPVAPASTPVDPD